MKDRPNYKLQLCLAPIPLLGFLYAVFYAFAFIKKRKGYLCMFGYYFCLVIPVILLFLIGSLLMFKVIHMYCSAAWAIVTLDCLVFYAIFLAAAYTSILIESIYVKKFVGTDSNDKSTS